MVSVIWVGITEVILANKIKNQLGPSLKKSLYNFKRTDLRQMRF